MEKGDKLTGGPYWTQNWIEAMWRFTAERFVDFDTGTVDFEALGREEYEFRKALFFRNFKNSPRAREAFDAAADDYSKKVANGQKGGRPKKDTTADAPTREDGEFKSGSGNAGNLGSATPAKPSLAYSGKNGLVRLTDDEYALLLQELGNKRKADRLIDDLDYKLAEGATFRQPHLHVLTHWQSYREDKAAEAAETAKARAAANAEAFGNVDRRTPFQKNQDELHQLYVLTSEKLKEVK